MACLSFARISGKPKQAAYRKKGSRVFNGCRSQTDSYYSFRAREAGLRTIGRSATPELGSTAVTESFLNGITRNPWDLERPAGGSSGGAAAAVAAGITPIAHGSDGGVQFESRRRGADLGLNPSRGRISGGPDN